MTFSKRLGLVSLGLTLVGGCTDRVISVSGFEEIPEDDTTPPEDDEPPEDDGPIPPEDDEPPFDCVDEVIPSDELPVLMSGSLGQGESRFQPSCVGAQSAERTLSFTAPRNATYFFNTMGSTFDTVLYALGPGCEQPELACNDDSNETLDSEIGVPLSEGESIVVVIDGFGEPGEWVLDVREGGGCPEGVLEPVAPLGVGGTLDTYSDTVAPSCGGSGRDATFVWVPPYSSVWSFSTEGSNFDTVLAVYRDACQGELACDDDSNGNLTSYLELELEGGVPVVLAVDTFDGTAGSFELFIQEV